MISNLSEVFSKYNDEYLGFEDIPKKDRLHRRPDLCGMLYLDRLLQGDEDMIESSDHDEILLNVSVEGFRVVATEEDVVYLLRCGILYFNEYNSLGMFT